MNAERKMKLRGVYCLLVVVVSAGIAGTATAEKPQMIELSGELTGTLTAGTPYHVTGDLYVPPGSTVSLEAGTVLLFSGFSGLHVQGTLYAKGTTGRPVVFTSEFDTTVTGESSVTPAPFDWNGIDVYESAVGTEFSHCTIRYSVYGIRSQTEYLKIADSRFSDNGKSDFSIREIRKEVERNRPFSYGNSQPTLTPTPLSTTIAASTAHPLLSSDPGISAHRKSTRVSPGKQVLRYTGLLLGAGSGVFSVITYLNKYRPAAGELADLSELDELEMRTKTSEDWEAAKRNRNTYLLYTGAGAGAAFLGLLAFSISFSF